MASAEEVLRQPCLRGLVQERVPLAGLFPRGRLVLPLASGRASTAPDRGLKTPNRRCRPGTSRWVGLELALGQQSNQGEQSIAMRKISSIPPLVRTRHRALLPRVSSPAASRPALSHFDRSTPTHRFSIPTLRGFWGD